MKGGDVRCRRRSAPRSRERARTGIEWLRRPARPGAQPHRVFAIQEERAFRIRFFAEPGRATTSPWRAGGVTNAAEPSSRPPDILGQAFALPQQGRRFSLCENWCKMGEWMIEIFFEARRPVAQTTNNTTDWLPPKRTLPRLTARSGHSKKRLNAGRRSGHNRGFDSGWGAIGAFLKRGPGGQFKGKRSASPTGCDAGGEFPPTR